MCELGSVSVGTTHEFWGHGERGGLWTATGRITGGDQETPMGGQEFKV